MPETERYVLRPLEKSDLPTVARWLVDPEALATFDRSQRIPMSVAATEEAWADALAYRSDRHWFVIEDAADSTAVGMVGLEGVNLINGDAVLPLYLEHTVRNRGIGIRASAMVLDLGFRQLGLHRVTTYHRADNAISQAVVTRLGFRPEGCLRQAWFSCGTRVDMVVVGLLQGEWLERRASLAAELEPSPVVSFGPSKMWRWPPSEAEA